MAYQTCHTCGGSGLNYKTGRKPCSSCNGSGTDRQGGNCFGCLGSGYNDSNETTTCWNCGGSGQKHVADPPARKPKKSHPKQPPKKKVDKSEDQAKGVIGFIAFLVVAIATYHNSEENLILSGILGLIAGFIASRFYKAIIVIGVIIAILYFIGSSQ